MENIDFARFALAFVFVLALIGIMAFVLKRFGRTQQWLGAKEGEGRIGVVETQHLDSKRRLVLVRRDQAEHLLLLADGRELVVEANIKDIKNNER